MRLVRYGEMGQEKPGVMDEAGQIRDLSKLFSDITPDVFDDISAINPADFPVINGTPRYGVPFRGINKIICIGLNYHDHAAETGKDVPSEPIVFMKATSALNGPYDPIRIPRGSQKSDWEVELGVVIGKDTKYVSEENALDHVFGYTLINDVSERHFQAERGGQWTKGKSCDTFAPVGPWLVTADEIADPQDLKLTTKVNDQIMQNGSTADMIFKVAHIVSYLSQMMRLEPGDIIATGTPAGVAAGIRPPQFLKPGDRLELNIDGLGTQRSVIDADS
ncbi:fumarylacetoacetate hydrolase family protein [Parasulfitobacter algicola]|uniref:Fumarylacetoacetate hydrolase family protein n=1 Tax=Parasulfitobacter algicola TaxID=2614809 RepID=A0ABX2IKY7_9RHOB|nr:fumarylacetoacetate hydrolase family protein [Sulfitobacter algicola]NSX53517.1 fumarylacetoacetate hydrolase family protein [Sulfitobacter algicola]